MKKITVSVLTGFVLLSQVAQAQWGVNPFSGGGMMPWSNSQSYVQPQYAQPSFGSMMPWGGQAPAYRAPVYQAPQNSFSAMMPWGTGSAPVYQAPQTNGFASMMPWGATQAPVYQAPQTNSFANMMPWGGVTQPKYQQPQTGFMMPGMEQGIRNMMQPGKIMAEEATPGMYMKPTWR